jgi:serine/threonine-protein kinase HipA
MTLRKARIFFKDKPAGTLEETVRGGTRFTYATGWHTEIACAFPISQREHEWSVGLHPFFEGLGPEGWLREKQARVAHINEDDDFGLLLRYGTDCIGAVGIWPPAGEDHNIAPITELTANPKRTLSGIQKKLLVTKEGNQFTPAGPDGPAPYIAKFDSTQERTEFLVRNENLSLRWSAEVLGKDEVTEFALGNVAILNEHALIATRFDRAANGGKLRLEDFAQILKKPKGRDFNGKYDASYEEIASAIKQYSARPEIDVARFFRRLIVCVLVGNADAHLKNFSLLETDVGLRLSPAYDLVNTALYDFDPTIALTINGKKPHLEEVTKDTLITFGQSIGLPQRAIDQIFAELRIGVYRAARLIKPSPAEPPEGFVNRYSEIVNRACQRILEK